MRTKAGELADLLRDRKIYRAVIETADRGTLKERIREDPEGVEVSAEGDTLTFRAKGETAPFVMLETAQILPGRTEEGTRVITTFAENGGLQIKYRL
jgi:hypothetical protein